MGAVTRLAGYLEALAADRPSSNQSKQARQAPSMRWPRRRSWRRLREAFAAIDDTQHRLSAAVERHRSWRLELVDALGQPALLVSHDARLLAANSAARLLLAIADDDVGVSIVRSVRSVALVDAIREAQQAAGEQNAARVDLDVHHDGHDLRVAVTVVGDETLVIAVDRTRERQIEELRRNFVVNASHELKTPVTSIQMLAEALQVTVGRDPDRAAQLVERLADDAEHLAQLVRDLLDLRRLEEAGPLERVPVDLVGLITQVVADAQDLADTYDVTLRVALPARALVVGIPTDLELIVKNLVENAVRYNVAGGEVEVAVASEDGGQVLTVRDTGIGIPAQDISRVFERFYRVDVARSRETGGTGLGLSIVRNAVERHGGTVTAASELGVGSTFTVRLPVGPAR